jgi:hypothetical protein
VCKFAEAGVSFCFSDCSFQSLPYCFETAKQSLGGAFDTAGPYSKMPMPHLPNRSANCKSTGTDLDVLEGHSQCFTSADLQSAPKAVYGFQYLRITGAPAIDIFQRQNIGVCTWRSSRFLEGDVVENENTQADVNYVNLHGSELHLYFAIHKSGI